MTDIVERLRIRAQWEFAAKEHNPEDHIDWQAADEIERLTDERDRQYDYNCGQIVRIASLEAEIERMRAALMILKDANENGNSPSVFLQDVIEAALEGK